MDRPYFISYSAVEARPFAQQLCTDLEAGAPPFRTWFDRRDLRPGDDWDRQGNSIHLANQGARLNDLGETEETLAIADEISNTQFRTLVEWGLAHVHLCTGDLAEAARFAAEARIHEVPRTSHGAWAISGVIALRRGEAKEAREAFTAAVAAADLLLSRNDWNAPALDSRGLALCGLTLCVGNPARLTAAGAAYKSARTICGDAGIVARSLRLFDKLAKADAAGMLGEVRPLAAGTE